MNINRMRNGQARIYRHRKPNGEYVYFTKEDAERENIKQGRTRMRSGELDALMSLNGAYTLMKMGLEKLQIRLKKIGKLDTFKASRRMLLAVLNALANSANIEQVCTLQVNSAEMNVCVSATHHDEYVLVETGNLAKLVSIARGGLYDENLQRRCCVDCLASMDRSQWQRCPLHEILPEMMCGVDQFVNPLGDDSVCPYALSMAEGMERLEA